MTVLEHRRPTADRAPGGTDALRHATWGAAGLATVGWLPFLGVPASPDEGGFLLVASQWHPGSSLYGNYWVDRPPLLIVINQVAAALGGTLALRIIGVVGVVLSVFLATGLVRVAIATPRRGPASPALIAPAATAAIFMTTPLFGTTEVDGELLSIPFVLAGIYAYARASTVTSSRPAICWSLSAGAAAMCAAMVKQNAVDVFVFATAVTAVRLLVGDRRRAPRVAAVFAASAAATLAMTITLAARRGTRATALWNSIVTFRFQAAAVIHESATSANAVRSAHLLLAVGASLAPAVVAVLIWHVRRQPSAMRDGHRSSLDLRWPAVAVLAWEIVSIVGGGSFWLHYLLVLVPGLVVLAVAAAQRTFAARRALAVVLAAATLSAGLAVVGAAHVGRGLSADARVIAYLREHARRGDTGVVAFGHPNILWDSHLTSPYPELWSLPVRVRDPRLATFSRVLTSSRAPRWVIVSGGSVYSWGLDATQADQALARHYRRVATEDRYVVWHRT